MISIENNMMNLRPSIVKDEGQYKGFFVKLSQVFQHNRKKDYKSNFNEIGIYILVPTLYVKIMFRAL